jgi:predicted dehydrogenase
VTGAGPARVGVIGAGVISNEYLGNLTKFPDLDVRFVADLFEDRAAAQAEKFGVPESGSVEQLLAHDEVEIVVNLTLPQSHVEVATAALATGKNVWSEKPFALNRESGRELLAAAEKAGLRAASAPDTFLGAGLQSSRRLLESGEIGKPLTALTMLQGPGPDSWHPNADFLFQDGAGPLFDVGPYYLTSLVQFFGPVAQVSALSSKAKAVRVLGAGPRKGESFDVTVPTHVSALYEFESGAIAQSTFSFDTQIKRTHIEVSGVDGAIVVPDPNHFDGDIELHKDGEVTTIASAGSTWSRGTGVVELARAIRADRPERASAAQGFHILDIMVSTIEAAQARRPVVVESTLTVPPPVSEDWDPSAKTL